MNGFTINTILQRMGHLLVFHAICHSGGKPLLGQDPKLSFGDSKHWGNAQLLHCRAAKGIG